MPYFKWNGINEKGTMCYGTYFAQSEQELKEHLHKYDVQLLKATIARFLFTRRSIALSAKIDVILQLATLVDAGVQLAHALALVTQQVRHTYFKQTLHELTQQVEKGIPLGKAMQLHPDVFPPVAAHMLLVGDESGDIAQALFQLAEYFQVQDAFYKKLRSAALLPAITLGFFLLITGVIFLFIVPRFEHIFAAHGQELPYLTQLVVGISTFLRTRSALVAVVGVCLFFFLMKVFLKGVGKKFKDRCVIKMPFVGYVMQQKLLTQFFYAVATLVSGGMRLLPAVRVAKQALNNKVFDVIIAKVEKTIDAGRSLSYAMTNSTYKLFLPESIALITVGQESGNLAPMLFKVARMYQAKVDRALTFYATVFQPLLMIILGLLIMLLVFAVYLPVFELAQVVSN